MAAAALTAGCGSTRSQTEPSVATPAPPAALVAEARPIGRGPRFQPAVSGPVLGACTRRLGPRYGVHIEVFAANRVVLIPAGIGTRPPVQLSAGRIAGARCYGELVTLDPTGVVLVRAGTHAVLADLFRELGGAAVGEAAGVVLGLPRRLGGSVRRRAALARAAGGRAAAAAFGDRARGRAPRSAARRLHVSAGHVTERYRACGGAVPGS